MEDSKTEPPTSASATAAKSDETVAKETMPSIVKETTPTTTARDEDDETPPPLPPRSRGRSPSPIAAKASTDRETPSPPLQINKAKPEDFEGEVDTNNELPLPEVIRKIDHLVVLDRHGKSHTFRSLYTGSNVARRVLLIFVRHFFCGNCQEFLRSLSEAITPDALLRLPISTFIAVVGCGDPALIDMYVSETDCPFPVYTDPQRALFDALGMTKTLALGLKPAYMRKSMARSIVDSVVQGLKQVPTGKALKSGDQRQVGGEFLFEPYDLVTPQTTPRDEARLAIGAFEERCDGVVPGEQRAAAALGEDKRVTWCHRMKTTRDHAEIPELMEVLGLDGTGQPVRDEERWKRALGERKGMGQSLAGEIQKLSLEQKQ